MTRDDVIAELMALAEPTRAEIGSALDKYTADLHACLAEVERENAALKALKWCAPWDEPGPDTAQRQCSTGYVCVVYLCQDRRWRCRVGQRHYGDGHESMHATMQEAKAAADSYYKAAGWFLCGGPARAPGDGSE